MSTRTTRSGQSPLLGSGRQQPKGKNGRKGRKPIAPVKVGDILCVYTTVDRVGTTSVTIAIEAWARRNRIDDRVKVTAGHFVYVALGDDGRKRAIPPA